MPIKLYRVFDEITGQLIEKECRKCGQIKSINEFNKNKAQKDGYCHTCRTCSNNYDLIENKGTRERRQWHNIKNELYRLYDDKSNLIMKECGKCHEIKFVNEFHKDKYDKDGYKHNCKICACKEKALYRKNNLEKEREKDRKHSKIYREKILNQYMLEVYEKYTKIHYPNKGIQYGVIYGVCNIITGRWYIGQTVTNFKFRYKSNFFKQFMVERGENNINKQIFQSDLERFGTESFEFIEILDVAFSNEELNEKEIFYINKYKANTEGYNTQRGGGCNRLYKGGNIND